MRWLRRRRCRGCGSGSKQVGERGVVSVGEASVGGGVVVVVVVVQ